MITLSKDLPFFEEIERTLVNHCSPVLFGNKPAALFIVKTEKCYACLMDLIIQVDEQASSIILRKSKNGLLIMVYNPRILNNVIREPEIYRSLHSFGYPQGSPTLQPYLEVLRARIRECPEFPHEIGFFLGYPSDDVLGFIEQRGENYKYCGLWKVYGDVGKARDLFQQYENCREKTRSFLSV
jgi:hypothetical protein